MNVRIRYTIDNVGSSTGLLKLLTLGPVRHDIIVMLDDPTNWVGYDTFEVALKWFRGAELHRASILGIEQPTKVGWYILEYHHFGRLCRDPIDGIDQPTIVYHIHRKTQMFFGVIELAIPRVVDGVYKSSFYYGR